MKRKNTLYGMVILGIVLTGLGLFLVKTLIDPKGILLPLPYILIGIGCGIFGYGVGELVSQRVVKNHQKSKNK